MACLVCMFAQSGTCKCTAKGRESSRLFFGFQTNPFRLPCQERLLAVLLMNQHGTLRNHCVRIYLHMHKKAMQSLPSDAMQQAMQRNHLCNVPRQYTPLPLPPLGFGHLGREGSYKKQRCMAERRFLVCTQELARGCWNPGRISCPVHVFSPVIIFGMELFRDFIMLSH